MDTGRIKVLPRQVAERIAAGEVVERPASVVKELVENSLDAGARRIEVELEDGGRALIRVGDDGCGMVPEDARRCFERHATSKIDRFEDLELVESYGFRGEALAGIGAVARVRLLTRFRGSSEGWEVVFEGGRLLREGPSGAPEGTDIVVRELFYSVPARRRFLKTANVERAACLEVLSRLALARPAIAFHLLSDGKTVLALPPAEEAQRLTDYFGPGSRQGLEPLDFELQSVGRVHGAVWHPNITSRPNRRGILIYVNRRPVEDRRVTEAVLAACRGVLFGGRFPQAVLFLELPGSQVDVNVHPAKAEVKFADEAGVARLVKGAVSRALSAAGVDSAAAMPLASGIPASGSAFTPDEDPFPAGVASAAAAPTGDDFADVPFEVRPPLPGPRRAVVEAAPQPADGEQLRFTAESARPFYQPEPWKVQGQFADTFILVEYGDRLLLIDQHAAHERIIYEELLAHDTGGAAVSQELLLPPLVRLAPREAGRIAELLEMLEQYGLRLETAGADSFRVLSVPEMIPPGEEEQAAGEILHDLAALGDDTPLAARKHELRASIACRAAVKAGQRLDRERMAALVRKLLASPNKSTCPHGRPTTAELTEGQIRRWFRR